MYIKGAVVLQIPNMRAKMISNVFNIIDEFCREYDLRGDIDDGPIDRYLKSRYYF